MKTWFYAVIDEGTAWFSTACRATCEQDARAILSARYPFGRIHSIER